MKNVTRTSDHSVRLNIYLANTHYVPHVVLRFRDGVTDTASHEWTFFGGTGLGRLQTGVRPSHRTGPQRQGGGSSSAETKLVCVSAGAQRLGSGEACAKARAGEAGASWGRWGG